jgi:hypothetical protein
MESVITWMIFQILHPPDPSAKHPHCVFLKWQCVQVDIFKDLYIVVTERNVAFMSGILFKAQAFSSATQ